MASRRSVVLPALFGWLAALPLILPAMFGRDFVQDDWFFLQQAREDVAAGAGIFALLLPVPEAPFWRPLGSRIPFLIYHLAGGYHALAMAVNLAFHGLGIVFVIRLIGGIARLLKAPRAEPSTIAISAFLLASHSAYFLPVAWASGVQDLACLCWMAAGLGFFVRGLRLGRQGWRAWATAGCCAGALLTKETGVLMVPLMMVVGWFGRDARSTAPAPAISRFKLLVGWAALFGRDARATLFVATAWLLARSILFSPQPGDSPYAWQFGTNVLRNAVAFAWYLFNGPREALRLNSPLVSVLGAAATIATVAALLPLILASRRRAFVIPWIVVCALPFLPLAEQSYGYYAIPALWALVLLIRTSPASTRATTLLLIGTLFARAAEFLAPFPAFEAKARWATEANARIVAHLQGADRAILECPSYPHLMALGKGLGATYRAGRSANVLSVQLSAPEEVGGESWRSIVIDADAPVVLWILESRFSP